MSEIKWKREIKKLPARCEEVKLEASDLSDLRSWLEGKAKKYSLTYLLAHADDGVIWGKVLDDGTLMTSYEAAQSNQTAKNVCPELRHTTLQQVRLFSKDAELLFWRVGENVFHARLIADVKNGGAADWEDAYDEPQLLWGNQGIALQKGFTLLEDGAQGLRHAVPPLDGFNMNEQRVQLMARHYLAKEDFARVEASRLFALEPVTLEVK